nr:pentatricopeptide repeat protein AaPPR794 [Agave angustifolia]
MIVDGLWKVGRVEEAVGALDRMRMEYECEPNTVTFNCLMDGFCKAGEIGKACELRGRMERNGVTPNVVTLNTLVSGMCRDGKVGGAPDPTEEELLG